MKTFLTPLLVTLLAACSSDPGVRSAGGAQTAIPFVQSNGILDWRAAGDEALYIRGNSGDWYFVRTMSPCTRLKTAITLGFITSAGDQLDRYGAILAEGQRCPIASIVRSQTPPAKARRST
jgi:hypothetical protein